MVRPWMGLLFWEALRCTSNHKALTMNRIAFQLILAACLLAGCRSSILDDPTTTINYAINESSHVKLTVENSYNTVVATLVDEDKQAGYYAVSFSMEGLTEGFYFYTLEVRGTRSNSYSKVTRHLLVLK